MSNQPPTNKKILFIITKSNWGGAQRYVYDLATNLDKNHFTPVVAMGGDGTLKTMLDNAGIKTISLYALENKTGIKSTINALFELSKIIKLEKPEVIHLNSSVAGFIGALAGRLASVKKIIFTAHGWAFNEDRPFLIKILFKVFHYITVLLSHKTIAVSRAIVEQMNWPYAKRKMVVINPGRTIGVMFDRQEARKKIVDFFPILTPYQHDTWIVCVAELHPIKRHTILFEAVRQLTLEQPKLRLICFGDGKLRQTLDTWTATHGMEDNIFVLGNLHEAARFLKAFDIFALASKSESYGYVVHEAGLAGIPVVATDVGGIRDIITHQETGLLVPPDNVNKLAEAIKISLTPEGKNYAEKLQSSLRERTVTHMTNLTSQIY